MTTVVPHLRLSWGGTLGVPAAEIWTNTLKWANDQSQEPSREALVGAAAAVAVPLKAWFNSAAAQIHSSCKLTWIKLNFIQANGLQRDTDTVVFDVIPAQGGDNTTGGTLWLSSYAITLRTGVSRGRGHAGRIFPPMCGLATDNVATSGYLQPATADAMALAFGTCIRNIRNAMIDSFGVLDPPVWQDGADYDLVVISASKTGDVRPPQSNEVVSVVVDRVPDIQHRRTNRLPRAEGTTVVIADIP